MSRSQKYYSEDEKLSFLREYHLSGMSKSSFCRAHGLCGNALLNKWLKKYGIEKGMLSLQSERVNDDMANRSKDSYKDENAQLRKEIEELKESVLRNKKGLLLRGEQIAKLEKDLKFSKDKVLALNTLIDIAEEQGLKIRKKSGAKQ